MPGSTPISSFAMRLREVPSRAVFVDYDRLCEDPGSGLRRLAEIVDVPRQSLLDQAGRFRAATGYDVPAASRLWDRARETHVRLQRRAA